jgi:hypothetical protein
MLRVSNRTKNKKKLEDLTKDRQNKHIPHLGLWQMHSQAYPRGPKVRTSGLIDTHNNKKKKKKTHV